MPLQTKDVLMPGNLIAPTDEPWLACERQWTAVESLLAPYNQWREAATAEMETLIAKSESLLRPFSDPLRYDFWSEALLARRKEPDFSRWLKWLLQQIRDPRLVFSLLGIEDPELEAKCLGLRATVSAEEFSLFGHLERTGRLDLVMNYPQTALIAIEVKRDRAEFADLPKQEGYRRWLDCQGLPAQQIKRVLLALDGEEAEYEGGFRLRRWRELTLALRGTVPQIRELRGYTAVGVALYFLGCVEQDVLGLISLEEAQRDWGYDLVSIEKTSAYLKDWQASTAWNGD